MKNDELDALLREWGALSKYNEARQEGANDFHALQRAREFAPGTRARAAMRLVGRDGRDRRRLMARELETCGVRLVPMDYVDPVRAKANGGGGLAGPSRDSTPPHLRRVAQAALELYRIDTLRGLCLNFEYCGYGSQSEKAERVALAMNGQRVGLRIYREALAHAKGWMHARLSMQLPVAS
jgi:hypothetical protein